MKNEILVAYASKYGSTAEIARSIADRLRSKKVPVLVRDVREVKVLNGYRTVILGSAVYAGQWRKEAAEFLKDHQTALSHRQVYLYSSGPTGEGNPAELMNGWEFPENLQDAREAIEPRDTAFFHGKLDEEKLGFAEKLIVKTLKAPTGDFRDWELIESWADRIAEEYHQPA